MVVGGGLTERLLYVITHRKQRVRQGARGHDVPKHLLLVIYFLQPVPPLKGSRTYQKNAMSCGPTSEHKSL